MRDRDRYGAAVHEAGHVVVAWALGLKTRRMAIGVGGDDSAGEAEIEEGTHLSVVDRIAVCSAGADAQCLLDAPTNDVAAFSDMVRISNLLDELPENEGETLRSAGYRKSHELLEMHRMILQRLAEVLADRTELNQLEIELILTETP